jgi:hypothetical protein
MMALGIMIGIPIGAAAAIGVFFIACALLPDLRSRPVIQVADPAPVSTG